MKSLRQLKLNSLCIHKKFFNDRPDLFERFFEINKFIDISSEPLEELTDRLPVSKSLIENSNIYCCSIEKKYPNQNNFPLYWLYAYKVEDFDINENKEKQFVTMNGNYSKTRIDFISKLQNAELLDLGYYSLWSIDSPVRLPSENSRLKNHNRVKHRVPLEWHNSLYDFQLETSSAEGVPYFFISEKTFRPLLGGKPFLNYGYPGMYKKLKSYGFKFECNLEFDKDIPNRFSLYIEEVKRLIKTPPSKTLVQENKKIARKLCQSNQNNFNKFYHNVNQLVNKIYLDKEMIRYLRNV